MSDQPTIKDLLETASRNAAKVVAELEIRQQDIRADARYSEGAARIGQALAAAADVRAEIESRLNNS